MKKITREEFDEYRNEDTRHGYASAMEKLWSRIQEVQSSEPMSVEEIEKIILPIMSEEGKRYQDFVGVRQSWEVAKAVQLLTVKQGFAVDWSKTPTDSFGRRAMGVLIQWAWYETKEQNDANLVRDCIEFIPRPVPKSAPKTIGEKRADLLHAISTMSDPDEIDELCKAAGIPTEVTE